MRLKAHNFMLDKQSADMLKKVAMQYKTSESAALRWIITNFYTVAFGCEEKNKNEKETQKEKLNENHKVVRRKMIENEKENGAGDKEGQMNMKINEKENKNGTKHFFKA